MRTRLRIRAHATHPLSTHAIVWLVLATVAIAACGLAGLALSTQSTTDSSARLRYHGLWLVMLLVGIAVLAAPYGQLLDDVLAPLRNLHKFDPLVRIPLLLGVANLGTVLQLPASSEFSRRAAAGLGVAQERL